MRSTPARRELGFVVAVAIAGLTAVLIVVFTPWYPVDPPVAGDIGGVHAEVVHAEVVHAEVVHAEPRVLRAD